MNDNLMTIGELSERSGVPIKTLRRYTDRGLVCGVGRSEGNYRLYDKSALGCLYAVMALRSLGLSLNDIESLNAFYDDDTQRPVGPWLLERLAKIRSEVDQQIKRLEDTRARIDTFTAKHADKLQRDAVTELTQELTTLNHPHGEVRGCMEVH